jgi:altronate dehydratase large subunit
MCITSRASGVEAILKRKDESMEFLGFRRKNGTVGTRNYVGVISTVVCANTVASEINSRVSGTACFIHQQGCCQTLVDLEQVTKTLIGLGRNPNLHSVLLVSLGCESIEIERVKNAIADSGKSVETIVIQEIGGAARSTAEGILKVQRMVMDASAQKRESCSLSELVLGLKCGSSDTTSGLASNPALGVASDLVVEHGGTSIMGETTEVIGAEHILMKHADSEAIASEIYHLVERLENRAKSIGADIRGGQPTGGNIKGGLTTIEEKSMGAIAKAGTARIRAVYEYGSIPQVKGLVFMDSPGREPELLTGLAAAGANIIVFSTGRGAPQGFPFVPVVKLTGNRITMRHLQDHMDLDVSDVMEGTETIAEAGRRIFTEIISVASGKSTKAEISGYQKAMDIYTIGPII